MTVQLLREGNLGVLQIDSPPVNAIDPAVVAGLDAALKEFDADQDLVALVVECKGRTFVAGGDIAAFENPNFSAEPYNTVLAQIEASPRPVVAALFGTVLGGGLELALACHARIAHPDTLLGLPEITLGLIPGSLGTQRLPRLAGLACAYRMISTGKPIGAKDAKQAGFVDDLAKNVAQAAREAAFQMVATAKPLRRASELTVSQSSETADIISLALQDAKRAPWLPSLNAVAECIDAAAHLPFSQGEAVEARVFSNLITSPSSRAMRHLFFAEREARKLPGLARPSALRDIKRVGILGVGTMGSGIAITFANAGLPVTLVEKSQEALERGQGLIAKAYASSVKRGKLTENEAANRQARMVGTTDLNALRDSDIVVEAVFEDMSLKLDTARQLGQHCKAGAIIATNTSTLDVDRIAEATGRPADVVGTHFFSPAHIMRLLEVVRGAQTAPDVLWTVMDLARRIGKTAAVSGVCYGFIGNRMAEVYMRESEAMQLEGATPTQIDAVAQSPNWIGMAMGPNQMLDMAGVDVGARTVIEWINSGEGPQDPAYRILCRTLFERGAHGQKTGHGYYLYNGKDPVHSPSLEDLAQELAKSHGVAHRNAIPNQEVFERLLFPMINEAARILDEGIAYRSGDIDVVWTAGYGFPAWRGGPVFMADEIGLRRIVERMDHYADALGDVHGYWRVAPLLRRLSETGGRLSHWQNNIGRRPK